MSARTLLNLSLLLIAGLLAAFIFRNDDSQQAARTTLTDIDPATVQHISLTRAAGEPLQFSRRGEHWQIDQANPLPADDFQLQTVLALLQTGVERCYPADSMDLAQLGLQPARAVIRLDDRQIELGNTESIEGLRYLHDANRICLAEDRFAHLLNAGLNNFLRRRLLPEDAQIIALQLPDLTLTRTDDVHWTLDPENTAISADDIQSLLQHWQRASALYVTRGTGSAPAESILLSLQGHDQPVRFGIVTRNPELVLERSDQGMQYHLDPAVAGGLLSLPGKAPPDGNDSPGGTGL